MSSQPVIIFDTTLRDGEQSPGAALKQHEKLQIAHQLAKLGVDVIEAGFPISSPGDFEAVRQIAAEVQGRLLAPVIFILKKNSGKPGMKFWRLPGIW
jgi:2-isopropylmalate synthase